MKINFSDDEILHTPLAEGVALFFCPNPDCNQPHMLLLDEDNRPMTHFIIGDDFYEELKVAMQRRKNQ